MSRPRSSLGARAAAVALVVGAVAPSAARAQLPPALAAGDLLVADANNHRILWVRPSTGAAQRFSPPEGAFPPPVGSFAELLQVPTSIVATDQGHIYVVDSGLDAIVEIDPATGEQSLLLDPSGAPIATNDGIEADAHGVLYTWDVGRGLLRLELRSSGRWRRTVVSDFERPAFFPVRQLTLTRGEDGRASEVFLASPGYPPDELPGALWQVDPASGDAASIAATEDPDAIYTDAEARGDCQALACTVVHTRCQRNDGIFGNAPSVEVYGIAGIFPLVGTLFDGFEASRCAFSLARGATAGEVFVATGVGYEDVRVERVWDDPVQHALVADLPRGPFDYAPYPVAMTRVVQASALPIPEPGAVAALAAWLALGALGARRPVTRPARTRQAASRRLAHAIPRRSSS